MPLLNEPRLAEPDEVYASLLALHEGLDDDGSARASHRLVLILANHIGDASVVDEAIRLARRMGGAHSASGQAPSSATCAEAGPGWMNPDRGHIG
jgi:hypothetical protein